MKIRQAEKILNNPFPINYKKSTFEKASKTYDKKYTTRKWSELL